MSTFAFAVFMILSINLVSSGSKNLNVEENGMLKDILLELDDDNNHLYNPNDMLAVPKIDPSLKQRDIHDFEKYEQKGSCAFEEMKVSKCSKELEICSKQVVDGQTQVLREKNKTSLLLEKLSKSNPTDIIGFYSRILHKFWNILDMEINEKHLKGSNDAFVKHLVVTLSADDISAFREVFAGENAQNKVDLFFEKFEIEEISETDIYESMKENFSNFYSQMQSFEVWLNMFWALIVVVFVWGFYLFILDIQRELRWTRVLMMVLVLMFLVSYIYHWRHMIKVRESQRHTLITKMELDDRKSGCMKDDSFWSLIKENVFGAQSDCEKYHEKIMISASEEVSPTMVLSETLSNFILLPLKDFGLHLGLFFSNFYKNIPLLWQIPATLVFLIILTIFLFTFFGYGIYLPFWLGGIRPSRAEDNSLKFKELIKESEESLKSINKAMINEAKEMLTQISQVAIAQAHSSTSQPYTEVIVQRSATIIEKKLEALITQKLSSALDLHNYALSSPESAPQDTDNPSIMGDVVDWKSLKRLTSKPIISSPIPIPWKPIKDQSQRSSLEERSTEKKENSHSDNECGRNKNSTVEDEDDFISRVRTVLEDG